MKKIFLVLFGLFFALFISAQSNLKVEPPFWWEGMEYNKLELIVYGKDIAQYNPEINEKGVQILDVQTYNNSNYLFLEIKISEEVKDGFEIKYKNEKGKDRSYYFELKERVKGSKHRIGVNSSDVMCLIMPDRFANGNPENDTKPGMLEKAARDVSLGRHGGDLQGITDHLDYFNKLGYTALWLNPVLENDMYIQTYHGYAITDFYNVDARLGTNEDYLGLIAKAHSKGIKVVKDMVFNHAGTRNYLVKDPPMDNWVHSWEDFNRSNYRGEVISDPYVSKADYIKQNSGWFDTTMADLDQTNPHVIRYLIQNSIWWIEYGGIDGIRMDTYPYPDKDAMAEWGKTLSNLYPNFTLIGEAWLQFPAHTAYWQKDAKHAGNYNSHIGSVFDFPLYFAFNSAINEPTNWTDGWARLYYTLTQDMLYSDPHNLCIFLDNHDVERYAEIIDGNLDKYKLALTFYATIRGIPQFYYGTEIMMGSKPYLDHGSWRRDFPGGWLGDTISAFTGEGLSQKEKEAQEFTSKILNWRKTKEVIHTGQLKHFIPQDEIYVYFRFNSEETIMVVLNKNKEKYTLTWNRYSEMTNKYLEAFDVLTGETFQVGQDIELNPMQPLILELKN